MYFPVLLLVTVLHVSSAQFAPNGTWIEPPYCTLKDPARECPPFNQLDDGTKLYEVHEYLAAKWTCIDFFSQTPQTSEEFYLWEDSAAWYTNFHTLRNYTLLGDNFENLIISASINLPVRTHMYHKQNAVGKYLKIANDFKLCLYMPVENPPTPNNPNIEFDVEPVTTYYVWVFNNILLDAARWAEELKAFKSALSADGVTDYDESFHIQSGFGPYRSDDGRNEIWLEKL